MVNDNSECVGSIFHVDGALTTGLSALADWGGPLCAKAIGGKSAGASSAGARTTLIKNLRVI
jgi:hypothetical protein